MAKNIKDKTCEEFMREHMGDSCSYLHGEAVAGHSTVTIGGAYPELIGMLGTIILQSSMFYGVPLENVLKDVEGCSKYVAEHNTFHANTEGTKLS